MKVNHMKLILSAISLSIALSIAGCDQNSAKPAPRIEGSYTSIDGKNHLTFRTDGYVETVIFGKRKTAPYKMEENTARYQFEGGLPSSAQFHPDGTLTTDTGTPYRKD